MDSIKNAFSVDGETYIAAARYAIPSIWGTAEDMDQITDLSSFIEFVKSCPPRDDYNLSDNAYYTALPEEDKYAVSFMTPQEILQFLMSTSASELITDNTLNQEQLQQLFQAIESTKAISLPLPGYPQNRGSLVHSQKYLLHEVQIKGRSAESVPVRVSPQRRLARPAGSWQDRISFSGRVFSFQGSVATEYHALTLKAIHLGTVSCEDGFARYFCKNDTFILRYIAFYWLFGILKNFRHFSRVFPDFGAVKPVQHKQKRRHRPKDKPLTGSAGVFSSVFSLVGHRCTQPPRVLPAPERLDSFCTRAEIPHAP